MTPEQREAIEGLTIAQVCAACDQIAEWAVAYVDSETCIPEMPSAKLSEAERHALLILRAKT